MSFSYLQESPFRNTCSSAISLRRWIFGIIQIRFQERRDHLGTRRSAMFSLPCDECRSGFHNVFPPYEGRYAGTGRTYRQIRCMDQTRETVRNSPPTRSRSLSMTASHPAPFSRRRVSRESLKQAANHASPGVLFLQISDVHRSEEC